MRPLRILTWHVHGSYLEYLSSVRHELFIPVRPGRPPGYAGLPPGRAWGANLHEVPAEHVPELDVDAVVYQSHANWLQDRWQLLSPTQRGLPSIAIEHDPPRRSPTETRHPVDDPNVLLVHVTHFNSLMWDSGSTPSIVIEHGVTVPAGVVWSGELPRGVCVVNGIARRERRVGPDVLEQARREVPIDLYGMFSEELGGLGEVPMPELAKVERRYRFFFNPIRWTSLGLAVCEAMAIGLPIVGLATTGMVGVVQDDVSGYLDNDLDALVERMRELIEDRDLAARLSEGARRTAIERFSIDRFVRDWEQALADVTARPRGRVAA